MRNIGRKLSFGLYFASLLVSALIGGILFFLDKEHEVVWIVFLSLVLFSFLLVFAIQKLLLKQIFEPIEKLKSDLESIARGEEIDRLGAIHPFDETGIVKEGMGVVAKELKNRDQRLLEQNNYTRKILDGQSSLIAVVREGKVLDCNQGFLRFFEVEDKEEFNQRFDQFIQIFEDVNKEGYLAIDRLYQESLIEFLLSRKEKISKVAIKKEDRLLSFSLLLDEIELEGKKHQIFVLNDITELEMYREALEKRVAAEIEKNRFKERIMYEQVRRSAMGELLVNIAHQWRQPLNNIGILTQDIEDMHRFGELNEKSLQANVQKIMEQIRGLSETISKFTGFYDKKDVLAGFLVRETVEKIISLIKDGFGRIEIEVKIFIPSGLLLYNNSQALEEILMALFVNSKEALERRSRESGQITISSVFDEENGNLTLYFVDDAGGIPKDILPKIFDPYFTTKFQSQGVGLGLFMARNIVENRMYGSISAANTPNGAKFTLSIPTCK